MKSRRLTETDLANMAFKSKDSKRATLISLERPKKIIGSYEPFRQHSGDALNEQYLLLDEERAPTPIELLEAVVARACKGNADKLRMNVPIAQATYSYAAEHSLSARREDVRRLVFPFGHTYDFGLPMLMIYADGRIAAVFPDLRRKQTLSQVGRRFVLSAMHHRWRENYPDMSTIDLEIWRYADNEERTIKTILSTDQDLIPYDDIVADVRATYDLWHEVLTNAERSRRASTNEYGPLFG